MGNCVITRNSTFEGINFSNVIATKSCDSNSTFTYTIPEDCWGFIDGIPDHDSLTIDGVAIISKNFYGFIPLKKGQVYYSGRDAYQGQSLTCYGIK